jgi:short-subunit dehydrogenase
VTALLPGATATDFHRTAGTGNTVCGANDWRNDPALVAQLGIDALFAGKDHVIGGDRKTRWSAAQSKLMSEQAKAEGSRKPPK